MALHPLPKDVKPDEVERLRWETFGHKQSHCLSNSRDLVKYVRLRGFALYRPQSGVQFPSVLEATCGRPLLNVRWDERALDLEQWKNEATGSNALALGSGLADARLLIHPTMLVDFCATAAHAGRLDQVPRLASEGIISADTAEVCAAMRSQTEVDLEDLLKLMDRRTPTGRMRTCKALDEARRQLLVVEVGSRWSGASEEEPEATYSLLLTRFPQILEKLREYDAPRARQRILLRYLRNVLVESSHQMAANLGWAESDTLDSLRVLVKKRQVMPHAASRHNRHIFQATSTDLLS